MLFLFLLLQVQFVWKSFFDIGILLTLYMAKPYKPKYFDLEK